MCSPPPTTQCSCAGCTEPTVITGDHTPVTEYCRTHGNQVADIMELLHLPAEVPVSFDAVRDRWRRGYNLLHS
jgi:hypothetical protein